MPWALIHLIPEITTGWAFAALIAILIAILLYKRLRNHETLIRTSRPADRSKISDGPLSRFDVDTSNCTPRQKLELAKAQLKLRHIESRYRAFLCSLMVVLLSVVGLYVVDRIFPNPPNNAQSEAKRASSQGQPASETQPIQSTNTVDSVAKSGTPIPFVVRLINPTTLEDEIASDDEVTVTDLNDAVPNKVSRQGDFFVIHTRSIERTIIYVNLAGAYKTDRMIAISSYIASQVPCDQRAIYLPPQRLIITPKVLSIARQIINDATDCKTIDKALVIWEAIRDTIGPDQDALPPNVKNITQLIEYNRARGNYQACVRLGYEQPCEISEVALKNLNKASFKKVGLNNSEYKRVMIDIGVMPLQLSYVKLRKLFNSQDYLAAAQAAETLLDDFATNVGFWEYVSISKSRLHVDAATSWLHYGEGLTSTTDLDEHERRCASFRRALVHAKAAQWPNFRRDHVPVIEQRLKGCIQQLR